MTRLGALPVRRAEAGAAAVEAALVLPLILLILFGTVQFGLAWFRAQNLEAAAREGARLASIGYPYSDPSDVGIVERVRSAQQAFTVSDIDVTYCTGPAAGCDPDDVSVWSSAAGVPCETAGIGELVHIRAHVPEMARYAIIVPLWGNWEISYDAIGVFRCERT